MFLCFNGDGYKLMYVIEKAIVIKHSYSSIVIVHCTVSKVQFHNTFDLKLLLTVRNEL